MELKRIDWIDHEKGFILLFVCLAHCGIWSPINGFHMAAFFFISGLLFKDKYNSIKEYVLRKTKTLLIPYFSLSFLFLLLYRKLWDGLINSLITYGNDIIQGYSSPNVAPLWFVYTLFQVSCLFYIINIFANKILMHKEWILLLACVCFIGGWLLNRVILPFKISTMITSMAFYSLGVYLQPFFFNKIHSLKREQILLLIIICGMLWFIGNRMVNGVIGYNNNNLGSSFIGYLLVSFFGIILCTVSFAFWEKLKLIPVSSFLKYIANNGIVILALHMYAINECDHYFCNYTALSWYPYALACIVVIFVIIVIPIFNRFLPWMIGK